MNQQYINTVRLLLDIAPVIFESPQFALKGGTALNLFIQNLPRLSIDIDVVFTDYQMGRDDALTAIGFALQTAKNHIEKRGYSAQLRQTKKGEDIKLVVGNALSQVKVEVNFVFRGVVLPIEKRYLVKQAQDFFTTSLELPVLAVAELYGSKLVAAMDRQHPRDLFDVVYMFEQFGLTPEIMNCFVVYLAGHNRPIHEVLFSTDTPLQETYESDFVGMTTEPISLQTLQDIRKRMKKELPDAMTDAHRSFLLSLVRCEPDWGLLPFPHLAQLPAIRWKLLNLEKLKKNHSAQFEKQYQELLKRFK